MPKTIILGKEYSYDVAIKCDVEDEDAINIVMPCHDGVEITDLAVKCIKKYTNTPYKLWIVDNFSNNKTLRYLKDIPNVNLISNKTKVGTFFKPWYRIPYGGSLCNAIALEIAAKEITGKYMFVMHNDCVPIHSEWLNFLKIKLKNKVKIAGFSQDKTRVLAVHQSGFLFDFELYNKLELTFMHNMPIWDVGDYITIGLENNGYEKFVCESKFNNPHTIDYLIDKPNFLQRRLDIAFNDVSEPLYLHLGRGARFMRELFKKKTHLSKKEWIDNITKYYI